MKFCLPLMALLCLIACQPTPPSPSEWSRPAFSHSKVELAQFSYFSEMSGLLPDQTNFRAPSHYLPAGTRLVAVVDEACLRRTPEEVHHLSSELTRGESLSHSQRSYSWQLDRPMALETLQAQAEADQCLIGIGDDVEIETFASEGDVDPLLSRQSHLQYIGLLNSIPSIYSPTKGQEDDLILAVIDTGVDLEQEDLVTNFWHNKREIPNNGIDDDGNGYIDDDRGFNFATNKPNPQYDPANRFANHGTHVAGLAAARYGNFHGGSGVMGQNVKIMALNVFGKSANVSTGVIDNAIRYAADQGADVINLSIGGAGPAASQKAAIEYAISKGSLVVVAAGNENRSLDGHFVVPASYASSIDGLISVGSVDVRTSGKSRFSNYSPSKVELGAPGSIDSFRFVGLLSTLPGNRYGRMQGTSMATPVVSGAALLAKARLKRLGRPHLPAHLEAWLKQTARTEAQVQGIFNQGRVLSVSNLLRSLSHTVQAAALNAAPVE